ASRLQRVRFPKLVCGDSGVRRRPGDGNLHLWEIKWRLFAGQIGGLSAGLFLASIYTDECEFHERPVLSFGDEHWSGGLSRLAAPVFLCFLAPGSAAAADGILGCDHAAAAGVHSRPGWTNVVHRVVWLGDKFCPGADRFDWPDRQRNGFPRAAGGPALAGLATCLCCWRVPLSLS